MLCTFLVPKCGKEKGNSVPSWLIFASFLAKADKAAQISFVRIWHISCSLFKESLFHTNVTGNDDEKLLIALTGAACLLTQITAAHADQLRILKNAA